MRLIFSICILAILNCGKSSAQLLPLMLNNRDNAPFVNPAMTGIPLKKEIGKRPSEFIKGIIGLSTRKQWTGFGSDGPLTQYARGSYRWVTDSRGKGSDFLWLGGFAMLDKTGPTSLTTGGINASFHKDFGNGNYLSLGLSGRYSFNGLETTGLNYDESDEAVIMFQNMANVGFFNTGWGFFFTNKRFFAGVSMPNTIVIGEERDDPNIGALSRHFYTVLGAYLPMGENGYLEPSIWYRSAFEFPAYYDIGVKYNMVLPDAKKRSKKYLKRQIWAGVGYDAAKAIRAELGALYDSFDFSLIYNYYLINPGGTFGSGLEIGVNFLFI